MMEAAEPTQEVKSQAVSGPEVTVVHLPGGQEVQVPTVIQNAQPSVIQPPQMQTVQVAVATETDNSKEGAQNALELRKRKELLARRPSFRKIFNEISADATNVASTLEEKSEEEGEGETQANSAGGTQISSIFQTSGGQYITIGQGGTFHLTTAGGAEALQGLQAFAIPSSGTGGASGPATILQYAQTSDGQPVLLQGGQFVVQAGNLQQNMVVASPASSPSIHEEPVTRKREIRLMKNREAARECRRKKKEYVKCLENRLAVLENQNKTLIEELKALKDLYCHKTD
ncbi:cyclic AMP-responsive element-binding protein 1-like isoform X2 [Lethenteron reissneri]|nr:cyclic AMP-responsive element-binding protein 1-like isoform X2 [Lethenteron reissneri]XP_061419259.1 cyclic AMP-responsive element-binding protein 1-like isoform X2 [Lethenteron reissneri]XP_061419260.1 cyclic AMP-responsive element-binding protein 1-like isoform X2 [Lethenteron reissneri]